MDKNPIKHKVCDVKLTIFETMGMTKKDALKHLSKNLLLNTCGGPYEVYVLHSGIEEEFATPKKSIILFYNEKGIIDRVKYD